MHKKMMILVSAMEIIIDKEKRVGSVSPLAFQVLGIARFRHFLFYDLLWTQQFPRILRNRPELTSQLGLAFSRSLHALF